MMLEVQHVAKTFNPDTVNEVRALRDVSVSMPKSSFVVIIGTNGSGKSTLLNAVAGTFFVDQGSIRLAGEVITTGTSPGAAHRARVSEPVQRHGPEHVHRGKSRFGGASRIAPGPFMEFESQAAR
jgi:ABC-type uncharacterized transport system ATPase component